MELSKRLEAVTSLVTAGYIMADIGTDHGYIPISLIDRGKISRAIAMDINIGPLKRAKEHIEKHKLEDKIELRLSDGMKQLSPGEVDSAVIAGMGGALMIKIIQESLKTAKQLKELIVQPQSDLVKMRSFLLQEGFLFLEEDLVLEEGKYYPMMKVHYSQTQKNEEWSTTELLFGRKLLQKKDPVLLQLLEREKRIKTDILKKLNQQQTMRASVRTKELERELKYIQKGLEYYEM